MGVGRNRVTLAYSLAHARHLSFGSLVLITRLFIRLLVHLQTKARIVFRFPARDGVSLKRRFLVARTSFQVACPRKADHRCKQSNSPNLAGAICTARILGDRNPVCALLWIGYERRVANLRAVFQPNASRNAGSNFS